MGTFRENTFPQSHQKNRNREIVSFSNPDLLRLFLDSCFEFGSREPGVAWRRDVVADVRFGERCLHSGN